MTIFFFFIYIKMVLTEVFSECFLYAPPHVKTNKMTVGPAKTQISLGICSVLSVFAMRSVGS